MICPECQGRKRVGGEIPRLCQTCRATGSIPAPEQSEARRETDYFRLEQRDIHTWREAQAFFAVCGALAESAGSPALVEMFRTLHEQADKRADELDQAELDRAIERGEVAKLGEVLRPPASVWGRS
jgi:Zn-finger nucleic acid-binding protein